MEKVIFNITEAAEEYTKESGFKNLQNLIVSGDVEEAFAAGAKWAFDMIRQHGVGGYIMDIETITEEREVDDE